ncbi:MAG: glycosyl hydrolase family 43 [Actinobacteria bacterium]|nr:glycosyl hydrolase family 43 [Actinomycetota bacterium]
MLGMSIAELAGLEWTEHEGNPLIPPPFPSPILADPTFLPPLETPDGLWHLFAHSILGIHHFTSRDGLAWKRRKGAVCRGSLRAFVLARDSVYYLFYERFLRLFPFPYRSRIEARTSRDLDSWSRPAVVMEPSLAWHREGCRGAMSNPCVVAEEDGFRLYYSAGLVYLRDCRFSEPKYIGVAASRDILGPYEPEPEPVLQPAAGDPYANMGAEVVKAAGGYAGFQNGIYWDDGIAHTRSAIRLVTSQDGMAWEIAPRKPLLVPETGWKKAFVYALDVRKVEDRLYLFFNARDGWLSGRENVGLAVST